MTVLSTQRGNTLVGFILGLVVGLLLALGVATYVLRVLAITGGYHRYFSHRSFKLGRAAQFALAFLAQTSAQKGVLWWASKHRLHHRHADQDGDVHSPVRSGFWWAHVGWIVSDKHEAYDPRTIADFQKFPELVWLNRYHWAPSALLSAVLLAVGGWPAFFWGFVVSTVVLYHVTFSINSLAHRWGSRRYPTPDGSRNNWLLAVLALGEGWHNNHHWDMSACRQGHRWWEFDATYVVLRVLSWTGVVRDLRPLRVAGGGDA